MNDWQFPWNTYMDPAGTSKTAFLDTEPFSFSQALSFKQIKQNNRFLYV